MITLGRCALCKCHRNAHTILVLSENETDDEIYYKCNDDDADILQPHNNINKQ